jgi:hypothetical protein
MQNLFGQTKKKRPKIMQNLFRPKKIKCVFTVTCQKNLRSVGQDYFFYFIFLLSAKLEIVVPGSGIQYFIFEISGKMTNYAVFLSSLLSISTKS